MTVTAQVRATGETALTVEGIFEDVQVPVVQVREVGAPFERQPDPVELWLKRK